MSALSQVPAPTDWRPLAVCRHRWRLLLPRPSCRAAPARPCCVHPVPKIMSIFRGKHDEALIVLLNSFCFTGFLYRYLIHMYIDIHFELSLMVFIWTANTNCSGKGNSEKGGAGLGPGSYKTGYSRCLGLATSYYWFVICYGRFTLSGLTYLSTVSFLDSVL